MLRRRRAPLLGYIATGASWESGQTVAELEAQFRPQELRLAYSLAAPDGAQTLRELSLKYYGSVEFWPLIAWVNAGLFGENASALTQLPAGAQLHVIHLLP